ncbi:hypothetical protein PIB30_089706 [Stylosanthes scabra]|uniref:Uncharacterized protein n=1 Tax=Stylosanthes scabra TaxID=79078 RepID=A0ABU6USW2_9FABA|nr:hypothetical protein [Stylosanthes scabra]
MARTKQTGKHTRTDLDAPPALPRLTQMSVNSWFEEDDERISYHERLSVMELLVPKHLADNVLPEEEYPEFCDVLCLFGNFSERRYFPRFVAAAYTTISVHDSLREDGTGEFRTGEFRGNNPHGTWNESDKLDAARFLNLGQAAGGKYPISRMTTTRCLLLYVLSYVLPPRKRNHGTTMEEDLSIVWAMAQGKQINWPYLIAHKMVKYSRGTATTSLGHAHLWTKILESLDYALAREEAVNPGKANAITRKNINQMRRNLIAHAREGGDEEDGAANRDVPMEDAPPRFETGTSSQVPSEAGVQPPVHLNYAELIRQGFQEMLTLMSEGFAALSDRMDTLDIHMTSQDVELRSLRSEFRSFRVTVIKASMVPLKVRIDPISAVVLGFSSFRFVIVVTIPGVQFVLGCFATDNFYVLVDAHTPFSF